MKTLVVCDMCAEPISTEKVVVVHLHNVMLAKGRTVREIHPSRMFMMEMEERVDEFHLCQECGAGLSISLHQSRKGIKIAIVKLEEPS